MTPTECVRLVGIVRALCPGQKLDEYTPDAWLTVLDDVSFDDAREAVRIVYRDRGNAEEYGPRRVEADDILREVRAIRRRRIDAQPLPAPPAGLDTGEYLQWLRGTLKAAGDGTLEPTQAELGRLRRALTAPLTRTL